MTTTATKKPRKKSGKQGFASLPAEQRSEVARLGGIAAHAQGTAHEWTSEEAQAAGHKGLGIKKRRRRESA